MTIWFFVFIQRVMEIFYAVIFFMCHETIADHFFIPAV